MNRTNPDKDRRVPWVPLILVAVLIAAAYLVESPTAERAAAPDPPETESAGGPASPTRPSAPSADPGASPSLPPPPAIAATSPPPAVAAASPLRAFRTPLEQSPGYFPPDDPESMSVITGRRVAPRVEGDFQGGAPTFESLLQAALVAIERSDEPALHALRVTREEFERFIWRELPQSRPVTNIQPEDAWSLMSNGSLVGAGRAVASLGGRRLAIVRVESSGPKPYTNFTLWRDVVLTVRDESSGEIQTLRFLSAIVERRGRFKVFSFKD